MAHPLIAVKNVPASSQFYQRLLCCGTDTDANHPHRLEYDRIVAPNGALLLELHAWGDPHGTPIDGWLSKPTGERRGDGVVLHFDVDDMAAAEARATELAAETIGTRYE